MISTYWAIEGRQDALSGWKPKTESFFVGWFGAAGAELYYPYIQAYNAQRKESS